MGCHAPQGRVPRRLPLGDPRRLLHRRHRPPRAPPAGARPHHGQVFLGRNQGLIAHPAPPRAARPWLCPPPPAEPPLRRPTAHLPRSAPRGPAPRPADLALGCAASPKRCKRPCLCLPRVSAPQRNPASARAIGPRWGGGGKSRRSRPDPARRSAGAPRGACGVSCRVVGRGYQHAHSLPRIRVGHRPPAIQGTGLQRGRPGGSGTSGRRKSR